MKHTPGPWTFEHQKITGQGYEGALMGDIFPSTVCLLNADDHNNPRWRVDGALIAAAPEMLEALKELTHFAGYVAFKDREADWGEVMQKAKTAINKAEGKS